MLYLAQRYQTGPFYTRIHVNPRNVVNSWSRDRKDINCIVLFRAPFNETKKKKNYEKVFEYCAVRIKDLKGVNTFCSIRSSVGFPDRI